MHEMGIANSILDGVRAESERRNGVKVVRVGVRVGELAAVEPESLRFCFEVLVSGTPLDPLALDLEVSPRRSRCADCGRVFTAPDALAPCPACGSAKCAFAGGDELEFTFMEIEEP
jgi:hydrogenase nickel incorporation protein HypA/HybF